MISRLAYKDFVDRYGEEEYSVMCASIATRMKDLLLKEGKDALQMMTVVGKGELEYLAIEARCGILEKGGEFGSCAFQILSIYLSDEAWSDHVLDLINEYKEKGGKVLSGNL